MKKILTVLFLLAGISAQQASANGLTFRFSEDSIRATFTAAPVLSDVGSGDVFWIYNDDKDANLGGVGLFVNGTRAELSGRAGVKAYGAKIDKDDGAGFAFGGDGALRLNEVISIFASLYIGPSYVSFGDMESYEDWRVGANFTVVENIVITASYGRLRVESDRHNNSDIEDGLAVGFKMKF